MKVEEAGKFQPFSPLPKHDYIKVLGTWVLAWNSYNCMQVKMLLMIAKSLQTVIGQVINERIYAGKIPKSPAQVARKNVYVAMWLKDFGISPHHYAELKQNLKDMGKKPIVLPMKKGSETVYIRFPGLFRPEFAIDPKKGPYVCIIFPIGVWDILMAFDKGYVCIDLNAVFKMRSIYTRKMYLGMKSFLNRGVVDLTPDQLVHLLKGCGYYCRYYSELDNHVLMVAHNEMVRLYKQGIIDEYFEYEPYYQNHVRTPQPTYVTLKEERREYLEGSESIRAQRSSLQSQLSLKLQYSYGVKTEVAQSLSQRLRLTDVGDLHVWLMHKDDFIKHCEEIKKPIKVAGYIVAGLNGFFKDHNC